VIRGSRAGSCALDYPQLEPPNRAAAVVLARRHPAGIRRRYSCGASRLRVQHPGAARLSIPSVASRQTTARTSWRGPIGTPQFFHSAQQPRTDDNARRDVQNTKNLALLPLFFIYGPQQYRNSFYMWTAHLPRRARCRRWNGQGAPGCARPLLAQPHARSACKKWAAGFDRRAPKMP
jgi:hypothetical protein